MKEDLFINKNVWSNFSDEEMNDYKDRVFRYYRKVGFPYFYLSNDEIEKYVNKIKDFDTTKILLSDDVLKQYMLCLNVVNSFMPHMFSVKSNGFISPMDCFTNDSLLKKAIDKRIRYGDNISDAGMRKVLSWTHGTQKVSNFRPTIAKFIYDNYSGGGNVLDFSSGFGGRLLGAMSSRSVNKYTGVDPSLKTFNSLSRMSELINHNIDVDFINKPFEKTNLKHGEYDLAFSSPPYFNTEEYSYESTQSFISHNTKDLWRDNFLSVLISKCHSYIKHNGYLIINVANVKTYKDLERDTISLCENTGFELVKTYKMTLSSLMGKGFKYEPIFVFKKI